MDRGLAQPISPIFTVAREPSSRVFPPKGGSRFPGICPLGAGSEFAGVPRGPRERRWIAGPVGKWLERSIPSGIMCRPKRCLLLASTST
jgi:hypothetical protein